MPATVDCAGYPNALRRSLPIAISETPIKRSQDIGKHIFSYYCVSVKISVSVDLLEVPLDVTVAHALCLAADACEHAVHIRQEAALDVTVLAVGRVCNGGRGRRV